jgi:ABC-type sugar transport system ATPase subunit
MSADLPDQQAANEALPLLLSMTGISKSFPGVVRLTVLASMSGRVKSRLLVRMARENRRCSRSCRERSRPDSGPFIFAGEHINLSSPHHAQQLGIVTIYQEFTLAPDMSVAENVFIGREPGPGFFVNWRKMAAATRAITKRIGLDVSPMRLVRDLSVAEQQMVEIARALSMKSRLIIMDEPTSALSASEVQKLYKIIRDMKAAGISVVFVTHRLEEVMEICDRYTVLRDGRQVSAGAVAETDIDGIIHKMVGREVNALFAHRADGDFGEVALEARGLTQNGNKLDPHATVIQDVSLAVRRGEILGLAGLVGAGRTETARAIFGADPFDAGQVLVGGETVDIRSPQDAIRHGIGLVPEIVSSRRCSCRWPSHERLHGGAGQGRRLARLCRRASRGAAGRGIPESPQHPHGRP